MDASLMAETDCGETRSCSDGFQVKQQGGDTQLEPSTNIRLTFTEQGPTHQNKLGNTMHKIDKQQEYTKHRKFYPLS